MGMHKEAGPAPPAPTGEMTYEPPRLELVVTGDELEREALYGGIGPYGVPP